MTNPDQTTDKYAELRARVETYQTTCAKNKVACELQADLLAALAEMQGEVERLPATKDGVRVIPGDSVWHPQSVCGGASLVTVGEEGTMPPEGGGWFVPVAIQRLGGFVSRSIEANIDECYSTREAALAARKGE